MEQFARSSRVREARDLGNKWLETHPADVDILERLGFLDNLECDYASSLKHLTKVLDLTGGGNGRVLKPQIYTVRAYVNGQLKKKTEALADIEKAIKLMPNSYEVYHVRGQIHLYLGEYKNALPDLEKALTMEPGCDNCTRELMRALAALKMYDRQKVWIDKLIPKFPTRSNLLYQVRWEAEHGDPKKAAQLAESVAHKFPDNAEAQVIAFDLCQPFDHARAGRLIEKALDRLPGEFEILRRSAESKILESDFEGALATLLPLVKTHRQDPAIREMLGVCYRRLNRYERGIVEFELAAKQREPSGTILLVRAENYRLAEQYKKAAADYARLYQLMSNREFILLGAQCWHSLGENKRALDILAIAEDRRSPGAPLNQGQRLKLYEMKAQCLFKLNQYEKSLVECNRAIALSQGSMLIFFLRAQTNAKLHKIDEAIADYTQAMKLRPDFAILYSERASLYDLKNLPKLAAKDRLRLKNLSRSLETDFFDQTKN